MRNSFLTNQIITYIGNKRSLLEPIEEIVFEVKTKLNKDKMICVDLFSGSGIVARLLKKHSSKLYVNDLELYSKIINDCYLTNKSDFQVDKYDEYKNFLEEKIKYQPINGIIFNNYAPKNEDNIQKSERVFYTIENAIFIDSLRYHLSYIEEEYQKFFLAPLIYQASVHVNTAGIFKGFYKDRSTGIGKFGGKNENALPRILGKMEIVKPIFSEYECEVLINNMDANEFVKKMDYADFVYLDPPYNEHPYGSNYFMLNVIAKNEITAKMSKVSGIPEDWNRSKYNKSRQVLTAFEDLIKNIKARFILVSYNSEGYITIKQMINVLGKYGKVTKKAIDYNTFKGSRNLSNRDIHVVEYLFLIEKQN